MAPQTLAARAEAERRKTQEVHEQEYQQALVTIKEKIRETEGPDIKETLMDQIRQWFIECRFANLLQLNLNYLLCTSVYAVYLLLT
jgi:IQ and AAA domain-containing protein